MPFWTKKKTPETPETVKKLPGKQECGHATLAPRWDSAADMGKADKITSYECGGCHRTFTREEGERLGEEQVRRATEALKNEQPRPEQ